MKSKLEIFTILPKITINWEIYIHFVKVFYTKVSRLRQITNSPKFTISLVLKQIKNNSLVLKWQNQWLFTRFLLQRIQSHEMNGIQCFNHSFSQDMQLFKDMNMIIKKHSWNKLVRTTDIIKEGSLTKASQLLFHSSTSV